jgi:uncharacterized RmlC-like cupin family protein
VERELLIATPTVVVGSSRIGPGNVSGWHHHGSRDTYFYVRTGRLAIDSGPGGETVQEADARTFGHVPPFTVHRVRNVGVEESQVAWWRLGTGPAVVNADGPAPAKGLKSGPPITLKGLAGDRTTGQQTSGLEREEMFATDELTFALGTTPVGMMTDWHHHGNYDTYFYVISGERSRGEYGPGGKIITEVSAGTFGHMPKRLVHREGNLGERTFESVFLRIGNGPTVFNVDGPDPE